MVAHLALFCHDPLIRLGELEQFWSLPATEWPLCRLECLAAIRRFGVADRALQEESMTAPISERLKFRRVTLGFRQKLASTCLVSQCTVKFIETGRTRPTASTLLRLLKTRELGLLLSDLPEHIAAKVQPFLRRGRARCRAISASALMAPVSASPKTQSEYPHTTSCDVVFPTKEKQMNQRMDSIVKRAKRTGRKVAQRLKQEDAPTLAKVCASRHEGKGILPDSCLGALSGRRDQVSTEGV